MTENGRRANAISRYIGPMFDAHAHIGTSREGAIVCSSRPGEWPEMARIPRRAYGLLDPGKDEVGLLAEALEADKEALAGEFGLDRRWEGRGEETFPALLDIAAGLKRPFTLHVVGMHGKAMEVLRGFRGLPPFIVHSFTGSRESALEYARLGGTISLSPMSARAKSFPSLLDLPFLLETDMPNSEESREVLSDLGRLVAAAKGIESEKLWEELDARIAVFAP